MAIRDEAWEFELTLANELNKLGVVRLFSQNDDPSLLTLRTYEGKVFTLSFDNENINDLIERVKERIFIDKFVELGQELLVEKNNG